METPYIKEMIERDIQEKETIKNIISRLFKTQILIAIIGFFLVLSIGLNFYLTGESMAAIKRNRQETITNRAVGSEILRKLDSLKIKN